MQHSIFTPSSPASAASSTASEVLSISAEAPDSFLMDFTLRQTSIVSNSWDMVSCETPTPNDTSSKVSNIQQCIFGPNQARANKFQTQPGGSGGTCGPVGIGNNSSQMAYFVQSNANFPSPPQQSQMCMGVPVTEFGNFTVFSFPQQALQSQQTQLSQQQLTQPQVQPAAGSPFGVMPPQFQFGTLQGPYFQPQAQPQNVNLQPQAITITLQYGSQKEIIVVERSENPQIFELFRQKARQMVERQMAGNGSTSSAATVSTIVSVDELQLYLHDYKSAAMLQHLTTLAQLDNGSVVEIIRIDRGNDARPTRPHRLDVNTYITPTFCDYCGEILIGLIKQGLQCTLCKCNFHKKCALAPRNDCAKSTHAAPSTFLTTDNVSGQRDQGLAEIAGLTSVQISSANAKPQTNANSPHFQLPHTFSMHNYKTPTVCKVCDKILLGFVKQGLRCRDCKVNVHKKCAQLLPNNCQILTENAVTPYFEPPTAATSGAETPPSPAPPTISTPAENTLREEASATLSVNEMIPLARLPGSAATRLVRPGPGPLCEGWMIHFVIEPCQDQSMPVVGNEHRKLRHYWILANGAINMYNEYNDGVNPNRVYKQIKLSEIIALIPYNGPSTDSNYPPHCFEIRTINNMIYCVGENLEAMSLQSFANVGNASSRLPKHFGPYSVTSWQAWFQALQQALQPPALRTDPENVEPALQFTQLYQICRDKVLGSGQFGTVYFGVQRQTGKEVAVKVIAKDRFTKKTNSGVETLKSEVAILQTIDHHGIIKLESMFETRDKIFVVMEKMNGDMLEMILSQASGRLDERCTKFLIVQILSALRYLHARGIAHCDLKPENVLLSDFDTNFPQTKLCDFGYARFIDDTQFRKTIVGTPAYLAPEVLKKKGYNKSLDMWSVGVIIYVTLSGTFPFNDGEEILDQIHNASFMFPADLWSKTNPAAIDLIQHLLRIKIEERFNIDECMAHPWLKNAEAKADLRALEQRLGVEPYLSCF